MRNRTLILCCGNSAAGDDALGPMLARRLNYCLPSSIEADVREIAQPDVGIIGELERYSRLFVVDASHTGASPGTVFRWEWSGICDRQVPVVTSSSHGVSIIDILRLAENIVSLPSTTFLAVEGAQFEVGSAPSRSVQAALEEVEWRLLSELAQEQHPCMK